MKVCEKLLEGQPNSQKFLPLKYNILV